MHESTKIEREEEKHELDYSGVNGEPLKLAVGNYIPGGKDVVFQANWNKHVHKKGLLKIQIGDSVAIVDRDQLYAVLFMLGSKKEQDAMVSPFVKRTQVEKFTKSIGIETTKDIKKGEIIQLLLEFTYNPDTKKIIIGKGSEHGLLSNSV